jgi:hypothetical protein
MGHWGDSCEACDLRQDGGWGCGTGGTGGHKAACVEFRHLQHNNRPMLIYTIAVAISANALGGHIPGEPDKWLLRELFNGETHNK